MDWETDEIDLPQNSDCSKLGDQNNKMDEEEESEVLMVRLKEGLKEAMRSCQSWVRFRTGVFPGERSRSKVLYICLSSKPQRLGTVQMVKCKNMRHSQKAFNPLEGQALLIIILTTPIGILVDISDGCGAQGTKNKKIMNQTET
ncbi:hypothetical protein PPACK8108_LOCUS16689 [Phakopsora pachyrhizi]|uniref:Uncharacterized protein n=1 Tax=Phakopsora pachyrhizi TaxID=170000 RepID=A0AAV0B7Y6_PHAPC|nr:hypothetical protein PPACK8108_LOCUS16689 [Phakopsora pachyrhizi]